MPRNKNIIRVGDIIRVINPQFVTRVGYDLTFDDACNLVEERDREKILTAMDVLYGNETPVYASAIRLKMDMGVDWKFERHDKSLYSDLVRALAYKEVGMSIKTGNPRKLFLETKDCFQDKIMKVYGKRCVKTGYYSPPSGGYDSYTGEYDYENGYLYKEQTHVLLEVMPLSHGYMMAYGDKLEIEKINVETIQTPDVSIK